MIIRNIFLKIEFHFLFFLTAFFMVITGHFSFFLEIFLLIFIHELGHAFTALFFHWKIACIKILPFGGITLFEEKINRPISEELWIVLMGPIVQMIGTFFLSYYFQNIWLYSIGLLLFNLLPIYPLDGSKIFHLLLDFFLPFFRSYQVTFFFSYLFLFSFLFLPYNFLFLVVLFFLFLTLERERRRLPYLYEKFLWERFFYSFTFSRKKWISGISLKKMKRDCYHFFKTENEVHTEKEILKKRFDFKRKMC